MSKVDFSKGLVVGRRQICLVTGSTALAGVLTASAPNLTSPTYQWQRDGVNIGGATSSTYTVTESDEGHNVTCIATGAATSATVGVPVTTARRLVGTLNDNGNKLRKSNGTNTTINFRRWCYSQVDVIDPQIAASGFFYDFSAETNYGNSYTLHGAVELRSGTIQDLGTITVNPGDILATGSRATGFTIPAGGFWIRGQITVASGDFYYYTDYIRSTAVGSLVEEGVGLTDKTLSGTITTATQFLPPAFIIGTVPITHRLVGIAGDSITVGVGTNSARPASAPATSGPGTDLGPFAWYLADHCSYVHLGRSGAAAQQNRTNYAKRAAFLTAIGATDLLSDFGVNDMNAGNTSAATTKGYLEDYYAYVRSNTAITRIYQTTITPAVTFSSGTISSDSNQVVTANLADGRRSTLNTNIRAIGLTGQTGFLEAALPIQNTVVPNVDFWVADGSNDGIHPNSTSDPLMVARFTADNAMGF